MSARWRWPVLALAGHGVVAAMAVAALARTAARVPDPPAPPPAYPVALIQAPARGLPVEPRSAAAPDPAPPVEVPLLADEPLPTMTADPVADPVTAVAGGPRPEVGDPGPRQELFATAVRPRRAAASAPAAGTVPVAGGAVEASAGWEAAPLERDPPAYPRSARRAGHEGVVTLHLELAADGRVEAVRVLVSSGFADLDRAACAAARGWRFAPPAARGLARAELRQTVAFRLRTAG